MEVHGKRRDCHVHPLDGLAQVRVNGWPAVAWIPDEGLLTTLLLLPWAATNAAKARTSGIQGRMLIWMFRIKTPMGTMDVCKLVL